MENMLMMINKSQTMATKSQAENGNVGIIIVIIYYSLLTWYVITNYYYYTWQFSKVLFLLINGKFLLFCYFYWLKARFVLLSSHSKLINIYEY